MRDRESFFNEYVQELRKKEKEENKAKKDQVSWMLSVCILFLGFFGAHAAFRDRFLCRQIFFCGQVARHVETIGPSACFV